MMGAAVDNRVRGVPWSDVDDEGLIPPPCVLVRVLLRDRLLCGHERGGRGHLEAEPSFQGGWRHVRKDAIGEDLRAGVTKMTSPKGSRNRSALVDLQTLP